MKNRFFAILLATLAWSSFGVSRAADDPGIGIAEVEIKSALWKGPTGQSLNVTARLKQLVKSGATSVHVTDKEVGGGKDPAPRKQKTLVIKYSVNGQEKEVTSTEGSTLDLTAFK